MPNPRTYRPRPSRRATALATVLATVLLVGCDTVPRNLEASTARPDPVPPAVTTAPPAAAAPVSSAEPQTLKDLFEAAVAESASEPDDPEPAPDPATAASDLVAPPEVPLTPLAFNDPDLDLTTDAAAAHDLLTHFFDSWTFALQTGNRTPFTRTFSPSCGQCAAFADAVENPPLSATVDGADVALTALVRGSIVETGEEGWAFSFDQEPLVIASSPSRVHIRPGLAGTALVRFGWGGHGWLVESLAIATP